MIRSNLWKANRPVPALRRHLLGALVLLPIFSVVFYMSFWFRFEGRITHGEWQVVKTMLGGAVLVKLLVFGGFRIDIGWNRYATFHDMVKLVNATTVGTLLIVLGDYLFFPWIQIPRSVCLIDWGLSLVTVGGLLSMHRVITEVDWGRAAFTMKRPVFIVGDNDSGEALLRALRRNQNSIYRVVGFIAEKANTIGSRIGGVPVIGTVEDTCQLAERSGVSEVLITAGELPGRMVRDLVKTGLERNVDVKVLPSYDQLLEQKMDIRPRDVGIEDLLQRDMVEIKMGELHQWIDNRVLLVTGSAGSIGSEICRQLLSFSPKKIVLLDRSENGQFHLERELRLIDSGIETEMYIADINDAPRIHAIFQACRPDIVFHAAAYKHVPLMEENVGEALKNITLATRLLANMAHRHRCSSFVMISTDKAVNPTSVMGACKWVAEHYVQALAAESSCRFVTVRFGNVLDSAGSVIPIFRDQIARGGPVTVTHPDMTRFFMTIPEASQLVIQAGAMGRGGEVFVLDMGDPVRIVDLATDMIRLSGLRVNEDVDIVFTGTRAGEKLFEELHADGEVHLNTSHPKIMVAESKAVSRQVLEDAMRRLDKITEQPRELVVESLRHIVPGFGPAEKEQSGGLRRAA